MEKEQFASGLNEIRRLLEDRIPSDDKTRNYEKCITRFADQHRSEEEIEILRALMDAPSDVSYKAFYCLATIFRHTRDYSKLRELIEKAEADDRFRNRVSLKHIRVMYETHSESLYDYDELLALAHESACELYDNPGYLHTFANAFATICENCLSEDLNQIMDEWYESALLFVNRAIEMEPEYAKYYSTKARIIALKKQFDEANQLLLKAIDTEDSRKKDYSLLIGNYQHYRTMISMKKQLWLHFGDQRADPSAIKKPGLSSSRFQETHTYAFISYSHKNSEIVFDLVDKLRNRGINLWCDVDIPGGEEWDQEIGKRLLESKTVIMFLSQAAILSRNVRNEIRMAQNHGIPIIPVFIEEVSLSPGAELQLSGYQAYFYYKINEASFLDSLSGSLSSITAWNGKTALSQPPAKEPGKAAPVKGISIIEKFCAGKTGIPEQNEDMIVETDDFLAVIDGASSKNQANFNGKAGGRLAAEFIGSYIRGNRLERTIDGKTAVAKIQIALQEYSEQMGFKKLGIHLCASAVIFSVARRQIWSVGDCQFSLNGKLYTFHKKVDEILSQTRALAIQMLINAGETEESLMENDKARGLILDELAMQKYLENKSGEYGYSVFSDQGKIQNSFIINVPAGTEVILASDGYPIVYDTLEKSERYLLELIESDPLCYKKYRSTKGLTKGNQSFDDRTYVRFRLAP